MRVGWGILMAIGWAARVASAQTVVRGIVLDANGDPVPGAQVAIEKLQLATAVGSVGEFAFLTVPSGRHQVVARAIGFKPGVREFRATGRDTILLEIRLEGAPQQLDSLVATGAPVAALTPAMREFEERRARGFGRFLTREMLAKRDHSALSDVLRMTAGLRLIRRPSECGGGFAVATGRGGDLEWQRWMACRGGTPFPGACYLSVYLDGIRVWTWGDPEPPNMDETQTNSLEGVEIYRGPSELPSRFQTTGSACGAILFWTRQG